MRRYDSIPIGDLVSDVPVDPVHSRELADSIMTRGQLAPVIIREETRELIDGFHRVAAMKELGFNHVECVVTPCDDEGFWDFRIIQASLHKNVTFARAIDWIEKVFQLSMWTDRYKNPASLFASVRKGDAPQEVVEWAQAKGKIWGLAPATIENWMYTKESLEPSLLEEVKKGTGTDASTATYIEVAHNLPGRPELQRPVIEKAIREDLSSKQVREVTQAVRRAEDKEEIQSILKQPVSRTGEEMVREAKVDKILTRPVMERPERVERELKGAALLYLLDLEKMTASAKDLTKEQMDILPPNHKETLYQAGEECIQKIASVNDYLTPQKKLGVPYKLKEG